MQRQGIEHLDRESREPDRAALLRCLSRRRGAGRASAGLVLAAVGFFAVSASPAAAQSAQTDRQAIGPSREVVQERLYSFDGRFDLSLMGGIALNPKLVDHYAFLLRPAYHFTDAWSVEIVGGYVLAQERQNLTNREIDGIRSTMFGDDSADNEFADMGQIQWVAQAALRWSPIYGKFNLAAELPVHFGAYTALGGGVMGIFRESLADCQSVSPRGDGYVDYTCRQDGGVKPGGIFALGMRFYLSDWLAVRTEMTSFIFPDQYRLDFNDPAEERTISGTTTVLMFLGGASFFF